MHTFLPHSMLLAFLGTSLALAATPGPGVLFIVTRTLSQGRSAGLVSVAGVALGNLGNAVGASLGLAALFALSAVAFSIVKLLGACYLVYLGWCALGIRDERGAGRDVQVAAELSLSRIFRDGFWVALLNPKTAIFFAAFLPQFLDRQAQGMLQSVCLGAIFVTIAACTDTAYVLAAARVAPAMRRLSNGMTWGRYLTAGVFFGLGIFTAVAGHRTSD
ncbi:LysE family translocator [Herbaspirillum sp. AP02]|uniref:LysE family translocator n=1 Tax=unclassified Herbaspirillum TaxID=2624150 RepID=UPI0015D9675F|nr:MULTISPECIES: LysE family translocator [unclassified Herbaspirillum]MBG7621123.1 LysE family translocator [Herbaspirillum sp. AP02]NZD68852.1 LysE family translocator [Herbaspirillum sp. AP21]